MSTGHDAGDESLTGAWNFRDTADITGIRPGRLFRSSELSGLDDAGRAALTRLGITDVADLRSPGEVARRGPGAVPDTVAVHRLPFPEVSRTHSDDAPEDAGHEASWQQMMTESGDVDPAEAARRWMTQEYERFPTLGGSRRAVREIITLVGAGRPVLVHCFAGKDRTGFAVAVALEAAGVGRDAILTDYLHSNTAVERLRTRILDAMRSREGMTDEVVSFAEARLTDTILGVQEHYLDSARRVLDETYGDLAGYLDAAGVTVEDLARLRTQLTG